MKMLRMYLPYIQLHDPEVSTRCVYISITVSKKTIILMRSAFPSLAPQIHLVTAALGKLVEVLWDLPTMLHCNSLIGLYGLSHSVSLIPLSHIQSSGRCGFRHIHHNVPNERFNCKGGVPTCHLRRQPTNVPYRVRQWSTGKVWKVSR